MIERETKDISFSLRDLAKIKHMLGIDSSSKKPRIWRNYYMSYEVNPELERLVSLAVLERRFSEAIEGHYYHVKKDWLVKFSELFSAVLDLN